MISDTVITKNDIIDSIRFRIDIIEKHLALDELDYKAAKLSGGDSSCSSCFYTATIQCLNNEKRILNLIMSGNYGKET